MLTIETLTEYGANTKEGLDRCFGNQELYFTLIKTVPTEPAFDRLSDAIGKNDLEQAFEQAHALKGVLGNLSLTPLYEIASEMTELLRNHTEMDYTELLNRLLEKKDALNALL